MREFDYDYDRVYDTCYRTAKVEHKGMTEEWYRKKAEEDVPEGMFKIFVANLFHRIMQGGVSRSLAYSLTNEIINRLPEELYINVQEYIDEKPVSDIKYEGVSIKDIMEQYKDINLTEPFIDAAIAMIAYVESGCEDRSICFGFFNGW